MTGFDYDSLAAVSAVVREGTFESAARALNVTQSAVSQRIKQLEERLGAIVVVRGRPCVPTEFGLQLCRHMDQVMLLEHELKKNLGTHVDIGDTSAANLRIAVNSDSLATWFPEVIYRAGQDLNVHFDIAADDQDHTLDRLRSGDAVAAITSSDIPVQGFRRLALGSMEYAAVATPRYVAENFAGGVTLDALQAARSLVFDRKDHLPSNWMLSVFGEAVPTRGHKVPSYEGYLECCLNGAGWGMMPTDSVGQYLKDGRLVELIEDRRSYVALHWYSSKSSSEVLRLLANAVLADARKRLTQIELKPGIAVA